MSADISRSTFRPELNYTAVIAQQGRVQLDADLNEQAAINTHLLRSLTADLIGPAGGPSGTAGFGLELVQPEDGGPADLRIGPGRYYVAGVPVSATPAPALTPVGGSTPPPAEPWTYWSQPFAQLDPDQDEDRLPALPALVYLRVWDQLVTGLQDPLILEKALAGVDTSARLRTQWQVLPIRADDGFEAPAEPTADNLRDAFAGWLENRSTTVATLAVRARQPAGSDNDPCLAAPSASYRGLENQYYRFEVHAAGTAGTATLKWSRDNGSVAFGISAVAGNWVTLTDSGPDDKWGLQVGHWVELGDDGTGPGRRRLWQVVEVDPAGRAVRLAEDSDDDSEYDPDRDSLGAREAKDERGAGRHDDHDQDSPLPVDLDRHPFLVRWDHRGGGRRGELRLREGALLIEEERWIGVEDGLEIWFAPGGNYRSGDAWSAAARTLDGDVEWPQASDGTPLLRPPAEPRTWLAPLAWIAADGQVTDLRRSFTPLAG